MSDSNFNITKVTVDTTSQKVSSIEINGEAFSSGSSATLQDNKSVTINTGGYTTPVEVTPNTGYDGMKKATITLTNIKKEPMKVSLNAHIGVGAEYARVLSTGDFNDAGGTMKAIWIVPNESDSIPTNNINVTYTTQTICEVLNYIFDATFIDVETGDEVTKTIKIPKTNANIDIVSC